MTRWWPCTSGPACRSRVQLLRHFCSSRVSFLRPGLPVRRVRAVTRLRRLLCRMNRVLGQSRCLPVTECLFSRGGGGGGGNGQKRPGNNRAQPDLSHFDTCSCSGNPPHTGHSNPPRLCGDLSRSRWDGGGGCAGRRRLRGKRNTHKVAAALGAQVKSQHVARIGKCQPSAGARLLSRVGYLDSLVF